jgi:4-amino-4-deoxy-L-arabinose transferase-like glycosyltransferase
VDTRERALDARRAWELVCLGAIVLVAAWLRFRHLGLMEFKSDEALAVRIGRDILHGDIRTVGLTSSAGAANPPLFVYLTALPLGLWDDPRGATAFVGLMAVVAVALTYLVLRPRFGALTALAASALLATAPWAVLYGRKLWAQDLLPVVTISLLWSLFVLLERSRSRWVLLVPLLLSLCVQLNFSALALVLPVVVVVLYRWRHVHWWAFLAGIGVSVVLLAPWLAHNAKHRFRDVTALVKEGRGHGGSSTPGEGAVEAVRQTVHLVGAGGWSFVAGASRRLLTDEAGWAWTVGRVAGVIAVVGLALGLVTCAVVVLRRTRFRRAWPPVELDLDAARRGLLLVWVLGIWLSYATSSKEKVAPHYLIATYPITFALIGLGLSDLTGLVRGRAQRGAELAAGAVVALVALAFVAFTLSFHDFLSHHGGTAGDYGVIYRDQARLAAAGRRAGLNFDDQVLEFLTTGSFDPPPGTTRFVATRNRLVAAAPVPCHGDLRTFGPLEACFPP